MISSVFSHRLTPGYEMSRAPYLVDVDGNLRLTLLHGTSRSSLHTPLAPFHLQKSPIQTRVLPPRRTHRHVSI